MTRKQLESLGDSDGELAGRWERYTGRPLPRGGPFALDPAAADSRQQERARTAVFRLVSQWEQGVYINPEGPVVGSYAVDDPESHKAHWSGGGEDGHGPA
jgi:hypothetical protein